MVEKIKNRELENAMKQMKLYQKELFFIKNKVKNQSGYDKIAELETKIKNSSNENTMLHKEIKALNKLEKTQDKKFDRLFTDQEYENKITMLNEHLNKLKIHAKELEGKCESTKLTNLKFNNYYKDLKDKLKNTKSFLYDHENTKSTPILSVPVSTKSYDSIRKMRESLQTKLEQDKVNNRKEHIEIVLEIKTLTNKLKNILHDNYINGFKVRSFSRIMKNNPSKIRLHESNKIKELGHKKLSFIKTRNKIKATRTEQVV